MDVKKMSESEQAEVREICSDNVMYTTPLVWKVGVQKPNESVLAITTGLRQQSVVMKGVLTRYGSVSSVHKVNASTTTSIFCTFHTVFMFIY